MTPLISEGIPPSFSSQPCSSSADAGCQYVFHVPSFPFNMRLRRAAAAAAAERFAHRATLKFHLMCSNGGFCRKTGRRVLKPHCLRRPGDVSLRPLPQQYITFTQQAAGIFTVTHFAIINSAVQCFCFFVFFYIVINNAGGEDSVASAAFNRTRETDFS